MTRYGAYVRHVSTGGSAQSAPGSIDREDVTALMPVVRRVIAARVGSHPAADDLVQETLVRVLAALPRIAPEMLEAYAIVTARNVVASSWRDQDRQRRNLHRVVDLDSPAVPEDSVVLGEEQAAIGAALGRLTEDEQRTLLAHEVAGQDTKTMASAAGTTAGAVAASLHRTRARLRVEYLLVLEGVEPPTGRCRPVLLALSSGDRRRQGEVEASRHVLECDFCARICPPLLERSQPRDDEVRVAVRSDADVVAARQAARSLAERLGFSRADLTIIATAVSEVTRNIVRFAGAGDVVVQLVEGPPPGVRVVASDAGPGIRDVPKAMTDGYSTYDGLGIGLPGARRLMDEFAIASEPGRGTTVTMTKWCEEGRR